MVDGDAAATLAGKHGMVITSAALADSRIMSRARDAALHYWLLRPKENDSGEKVGLARL